jgi:NADH-quinone oxidoreductase subunit A
MTDLVGHLLLFSILGIVFLLLPLVAGLFVRPANPTGQKLAAYECGEPTIGTAYIQFDLRFYVVALLFIIFDVEVAFFFPWAAVFGGATQLLDSRLSQPARIEISERILNVPAGSLSPENVISEATARSLALGGLVDILVFFSVLLVAFAYVWKRGDLDWVRALADSSRKAARTGPASGVGARATPAERPLETVA